MHYLGVSTVIMTSVIKPNPVSEKRTQLFPLTSVFIRGMLDVMDSAGVGLLADEQMVGVASVGLGSAPRFSLICLWTGGVSLRTPWAASLANSCCVSTSGLLCAG